MAPPSPPPPPQPATGTGDPHMQQQQEQQQRLLQQQQQQQKEEQQRRQRAAWEASLPASEAQLARLARLEELVVLDAKQQPPPDSNEAAAAAAAAATHSYTPSHPFPPPPVPATPSSSSAAAAAASHTPRIITTGGRQQLPLPPLAPPPAHSAGAHRQRVERLLALIALEEEETTAEGWEGEGGKKKREAVVPSDPDALAGAAAWYATVLAGYGEGLGAVVAELTAALGCLDAVGAGHETVSGKAESLHATCEGLLGEQQSLEQRRALLAGPMDFFNELERLGPLLGLPGGTAASPNTHTNSSSSVLFASSSSSSSSPSRLRPGAIAGGGGAGGLLFVRAQPGSEEFAEALGRIDHAIAFFQSHPQYKDSGAYLRRMRALQARGLGLAKQQAVHLLEGAARAALAKKGFESLETSPIYQKFRGIAPRVRALVGLIAARAFAFAPAPASSGVSTEEGEEEAVEAEEEREHRQALAEMVEEVKKCYTHKRWQLLKPVLRAHLQAQAAAASTNAASGSEGGPTRLVRTGAAVLSRLCQLEAQLHDSCFGPLSDSDTDSDEADEEEGKGASMGEGGAQALAPRPYRAGSQQFWEDGSLFELLRGLCLLLHELVRPLVIHEGDLDRLCQLINVVREEILEGQAPLRGESGLALEGVLDRIAKDAQERLIYAAERVLRVEVEGFRPQPQDLDYPNKLARYWYQRLGGGQRESSSGSSGNSDTPLLPPLYATWFPSLHATLALLAKIYRAVEVHVFQEMAQQALASCHASLLAAARLIRARPPPPSSPAQGEGGGEGGEEDATIDADLFLVKHLLILREQLAPFDVEFAAVERRLDFKSTRGALTKFFTTDTRKLLFRVGADNALLSLAVDAVPTVNEEEVDSKRQLEEALKRACNAFIQHGADRLGAPLAALLGKARAFVVVPSSSAPAAEGQATSTSTTTTTPEPDEASLRRLLEQDFMRPERLEAALLAAQQRLAAATPALLERMALYLDHNSATRAILFKPVRLRVLNTLAQLKELLSLALAVAATHPQPPTTTAPFLLPPSIDGPLTAMRAALTRALDGGGGELLDASASRSGSLSSASSAGTGGGAGGDAVGPSRAAQTAGGRGGSAAL